MITVILILNLTLWWKYPSSIFLYFKQLKNGYINSLDQGIFLLIPEG